MRIVSSEIIKDSTKQLLDIILENGWALDSIARADCLRCLPDMDHILLNQSLRSLGREVDGDQEMWQLDPKRVAACTADIIMSYASKNGKKKVCFKHISV